MTSVVFFTVSRIFSMLAIVLVTDIMPISEASLVTRSANAADCLAFCSTSFTDALISVTADAVSPEAVDSSTTLFATCLIDADISMIADDVSSTDLVRSTVFVATSLIAALISKMDDEVASDAEDNTSMRPLTSPSQGFISTMDDDVFSVATDWVFAPLVTFWLFCAICSDAVVIAF